MQERKLETLILRHGNITGLSKIIEKGEKPPYEEFVRFMTGEIDPPIDRESTQSLIEQRIREGKLVKDGFDTIICSRALRAQQTSELIREVAGSSAPVRVSKYLREILIPMNEITPEFYAQAENIHEVRRKFMGSFLEGKKVDEDLVQIYRRAERFLTYFRRIGKHTNKTPLFVSHGIFSRFLDLAARHQEEEFSDDQIKTMVQEEFATTSRPGVLQGFKLFTSKEGQTILELI